MSNLTNINEWLDFIKRIHPHEIELSLDRIKAIANKLDVCQLQVPTIVVAGTNGKGSVVATLASIYQHHDYRVGTLTSPYLFCYNEQIKINNQPIDDASLCQAFEIIEQARGDISLTQFEYTTLAGLLTFKQAALDVVILEIGLGGRLDAVNIIDADVAVITSIGIDHAEWLGNTRELIAVEKAGILRAGKPAVCGEADPPASLLAAAKALRVQWHAVQQTFDYERMDDHWVYIDKKTDKKIKLPLPTLSLQNVATGIRVARLLHEKLPLNNQQLYAAIQDLHWPARIQSIPGDVTEIYDVAHNPDAVRLLAAYLQHHEISGKTYAVFSMRRDKDIVTSIHAIMTEIDAWFIAPLQDARTLKPEELNIIFTAVPNLQWDMFANVKNAYSNAREQAQPGDRLIIFGSFHTVAEAAPQNPQAFAALQ